LVKLKENLNTICNVALIGQILFRPQPRLTETF